MTSHRKRTAESATFVGMCSFCPNPLGRRVCLFSGLDWRYAITAKSLPGIFILTSCINNLRQRTARRTQAIKPESYRGEKAGVAMATYTQWLEIL